MTHRQWRTALPLAALLAAAAPAPAQDTNANSLFVEAVQRLAAVPAGAGPDERIPALEAAVAALDRIVAEHPASDLAVKIITGQKIGTVDPAMLRADLARLREKQAEAARIAALPMLERPARRPRSQDEIDACHASFDCFLPLLWHGSIAAHDRRRIDAPELAQRLATVGEGIAAARGADADLDVVLARIGGLRTGEGEKARHAAPVFRMLAARIGAEATARRMAEWIAATAGPDLTDAIARDMASRILRSIVRTEGEMRGGLTVMAEWQAAARAAGIPTDGRGGLDEGLADLTTRLPEAIAREIDRLAAMEPGSTAEVNTLSQLVRLTLVARDPRAAEFHARLVALDASADASPATAAAQLALGLTADAVAEVGKTGTDALMLYDLERFLVMALTTDAPDFAAAVLATARDRLSTIGDVRGREGEVLDRVRVLTLALDERPGA